MNKKLLSLVIAGVIAVTSLPAVSASAAEVSQSNTNISTISRSRYSTVKPGTKAYTEKSPAGYVGYFPAGARVKVYFVRNGWARVFGTLDNGEEGVYYISAYQLYD
ncbi:hypothetical protein [Clostridium sp. HBUAS56017]|uniref:hypothetical protein n=1 Tax=Clostridium sp. HBUAS56017 TaxID=2571128 RepID=UPI0011775FE2|nr:hypothetical protein [Clostridium sp. HBUAS56017]